MRVDFYLIPERSPWHFSCRLLAKAFSRQHAVYVHTPTLVAAQQLDQLLWTFRQQSFLPHALLGRYTNPAPPIEIGHGDALTTSPVAHQDVLLNLTEHFLPCATTFQRVIEIVINHPDATEHCAKQQAHYLDAGFEKHLHDLCQHEDGPRS